MAQTLNPPYPEKRPVLSLHLRESAKVSHERKFALLTPEKPQLETAKNAAKTGVRAPGLSTD